MPAHDYRALDQAEIEALLDGFAIDPPPSTNWRGLIAANQFLEPPAVPSDSQSDPTAFVMTMFPPYTEVKACFDDTTDPYRRGRVEFLGHVQVGAGDALFAQHVWPALLARLNTYSGSRLMVLVEEATTGNLGAAPEDPWYVYWLRVPVVGV